MVSDVSKTSSESQLQVELLESSFELVKPRANDFVNSFYNHLFSDYPAAKPLFAHSNMSEQGNKLLASLVFVVENLKKPGALTEALKGLGARHVKYGALPEHYPLVGNTLLKTFEEYLGDAWTPQTKQAWVDAYGVITEVMLDGADYSSEDVQLSVDLDEVDEATGLKIARLETSFEKVKPQANAFINSFYENLFTDYPAAKPLFTHTDMEKQKKQLLASLVFVVENLRTPDTIIKALKGMGARHVKYGALPEHYPLVGNSLLKTFDQYLGEDWTADTKQAWVDAYGLITTVMLEGADYSDEEVKLSPDSASEPEATAPDLDEVDEATGLKIARLEASFEQVKPQANAFINSFYENLFTDYPAAKPLFTHTDMEKQKKQLLSALVFVVENLRTPDVIIKALQGMGARHVKYGALPEHYPLVGNSLLKTFGQYLGSDWTDNTKQAWVDAYGLITNVMLDGADYSESDVQLSAPAEEAPVLVDGPNPTTFVGGIAGVLGILTLVLILL